MGVTTRVGLYASIFLSAKSLKKGFPLLSLTQNTIPNRMQSEIIGISFAKDSFLNLLIL
jgi:hypothetical protein